MLQIYVVLKKVIVGVDVNYLGISFQTKNVCQMFLCDPHFSAFFLRLY